MDISKYVTNKELSISNDDINIEKLTKDIRKGFVSSEEVESERNSAVKEINDKYAQLENDYNKLKSSYDDIEARNTQFVSNEKKLKLDVEMVSQGFKKEQFEEVRTLRNTLFKDEADDTKAIGLIKDKYKATYFPDEEKQVIVPNETSFGDVPKEKEPVKVTRNTRLSDLLIK